jgi:hypothetical protein
MHNGVEIVSMESKFIKDQDTIYFMGLDSLEIRINDKYYEL